MGKVTQMEMLHLFWFQSYVSVLLLAATHFICEPGSSIGIATRYGLDGPGIESWWWRDFPHLSRPALRPTNPPVKWVPVLFRG